MRACLILLSLVLLLRVLPSVFTILDLTRRLVGLGFGGGGGLFELDAAACSSGGGLRPRDGEGGFCVGFGLAFGDSADGDSVVRLVPVCSFGFAFALFGLSSALDSSNSRFNESTVLVSASIF